ncbi:MAG TPA: MASE4 domain-containing protein, partial [Allosphingosinicella sp.]|nr:MASE4 domain-containing protein [Allosphingosinicella sp.]
MSTDRFGLFDTPPGRKHVRLSLVVIALMLAVFFLTLPVRNVQLARIDAFIPMIDAIMFVGELIIATLLYAQASVFRSRALTILAGAFVFAALLVVPHALTFPGAFAPDGWLGAGVNSSAWIYTIRRMALPVAVIGYVLLKKVDGATKPGPDRPAPAIAWSLFAAIILAGGVTLLATAGHDLLPPFFLTHSELLYSKALLYEFTVFALFVTAMTMLFRARGSV